jgi:Mg/Co/Ni transporter MgtE
LAFLERQPVSAARALEDLDPADAAAFLETVPSRLSAPVVCAMAPWAAARLVESLAPEQAAGLIRNMAYQEAASVLRLMGQEQFDGILVALPKGLAKGFRNSLSYPKGTVGAWMDHGVPSFAAESTVADGLKYAKQRRNRVGSHIFVVEKTGRLAGTVSVGDLLRSAATTALAEIMDRKVSPLSNRAMLTAVESAPAWDEYSMLPVTGRRGNVLGGLTRKGLRRGLIEDRLTETPVATSTFWAHLLAAYLLTSAGLLRFISQPRAPGPGPTSGGNSHVG